MEKLILQPKADNGEHKTDNREHKTDNREHTTDNSLPEVSNEKHITNC